MHPRPPLLPRLLRLRQLQLTSWQRVLFGDAPLGLGVLFAMAGVASNWIIVALPAATLAMVKLHDVVSGQLAATTGSGLPGPADSGLPGPAGSGSANDLAGFRQRADGILQDH